MKTAVPTVAFALAIALLTATARADSPERSPGIALGLSAGTTVAGALLTLSALDGWEGKKGLVGLGSALVVLGPTLGNIYAGDVWNTGLKLRVASVGAALVGVGVVGAADCFMSNCASTGIATIGGAVVVASVVTFGVGTVLEIRNAPLAARRQSAPVVMPLVTEHGAGISLAGSF